MRAMLLFNGGSVVLLVMSLLMGRIIPPSEELAYAADPTGYLEIYRMDVDHRVSYQLTHHSESASQPVWSPDGGSIVYVSELHGSPQLYRMDANGDHVQRLTSDASFDFSPSWSPDGKWIAFTSGSYGSQQIMVIAAQGGEAHPLTKSKMVNATPIWSPDGTQIAFVSDGSTIDDTDIFLMDTDGQNVRRVASTPGQEGLPAWSPDGHLLYESDMTSFSIRMMAISGPEPTATLLNSRYWTYGSPDWSPDGRWLAFSFFDQGGRSHIYIADAVCARTAGGCGPFLQRLTPYDGVEAWPSWKPS